MVELSVNIEARPNHLRHASARQTAVRAHPPDDGLETRSRLSFGRPCRGGGRLPPPARRPVPDPGCEAGVSELGDAGRRTGSRSGHGRYAGGHDRRAADCHLALARSDGKRPRRRHTYDWIENLFGLDLHSADQILPEFRWWLEVGEAMPMGRGGPGMRVETLEPDRFLVFRFEDGTRVWVFGLYPEDGSTRLVSRNRTSAPGATAVRPGPEPVVAAVAAASALGVAAPRGITSTGQGERRMTAMAVLPTITRRIGP